MMQRIEWLKQMKGMAEALYDQYAAKYWTEYGDRIEPTHLAFLQKFLSLVTPGGAVLSAACGAGLNDGLLIEAGHPVVGIDQSARMLARAGEHFPQVHYEKMSLQEISYNEQFDGLTCIDALEHVSPEDYVLILGKFQQALKPGGIFYFTVDNTPSFDLQLAFEQAKAKGMPVVYGELVNRIDEIYPRAMAMDETLPTELGDAAVYHYYPPLELVRQWLDQVGLEILEQGDGDGYHHFLARNKIS